MIINATPHPITLFYEKDTTYHPEIRKYILNPGVQPIMALQPDGHILSVKQETIPCTGLTRETGIPIVRANFIEVDHPSYTFGDIDAMYIVSQFYLAGARAMGITGDFLTVGKPVYDYIDSPRPVGVLELNFERI